MAKKKIENPPRFRLSGLTAFMLLALFLFADLVSQDSGVALDFDISPTIEANRLLELAGLKGVEASGRLSGRIRIQGRPDDLNIAGRMHGDKVSVAGYPLAKVDVEFNAEWMKKSGRVLVRRIDIRSSSGAIRGSGDLYLDSAAAVSSLKATLQGFNLLPLSQKMIDGVAIASRASGSVALEWKGKFSPGRLSGAARLRLAASRSAPSKGILPLAGAADLEIRSGNASVRLSSMKAMGVQADGRIDLSARNAMAGDFTGAIQDVETFFAQLAGFLGEKEVLPFKTTGLMKFKATASGSFEKPELAASIEAADMQIDEWTGVGMNVDARLSHSRLVFSGAIAPAPDATLSVRGNIGLDETPPSLDVELQTDQTPLAALLSLIKLKIPAGGVLSASARLGGTFERPQGTGSIRGQGLKIYQEPIGSLIAEFQFLDRQVELSQIRLEKDSGGGMAEGRGAYNLDSHEFTFRGVGKDLRFDSLAAPNRSAFRGAVDFTIEGSGTAEQPVVKAEISASGAEARGVKLGLLSARADLRDHVLNAEARLPRFGLTANVRIGAGAPYPMDFRAKASRLDLALLGHEKISGALDADFAGSGILQNLLEAQASASFQNVSARFAGADIKARGPINLEYRDGLLQIPSGATIESGHSVLQIRGSVPVLKESPEGSLKIQAELDIGEASKLPFIPQGAAASGRMNLDLTVLGKADNLNAHGTVGLDGGFLQYPGIPAPFSDISIRAELQKGALYLKQAQARLDAGALALGGEIPLSMLLRKFPSRQGGARFDLQLSGIELKSIGKFPEDMSGLVSLRASGTAGSLDPRSIAAEVAIGDLRFGLGQIAIEQSGQSSLSVNNGNVSIKKLALAGPETDIAVSGSAGFVDDSKLNFQVRGATEAGLLGLFVRDVKMSGPVQLLAVVSGSPRAPKLSGFLEIKEGFAGLRSPNLALDSLNARINILNNRISIERLRGTLNGGFMSATGSADLQGGVFESLNVSARLRDVFLDFPEGLKSFSTADLTVASKTDSIDVGGKIRVLESSYRDPIEIGRGVMKFIQSQKEEAEAERSPLLSRMRFNVAMETATPLIVKNNLADLEADADLKLVGSFYAPSVIGRINLEEGGQIYVNERTYYITQGEIGLVNQTKIEPDLDIQAETTVSPYNITMQITGSPGKLSAQLSSDSNLSQADIMSVLLTGKTVAELSGNEFDLAGKQALSLLTGQASQEVSRGARGVLGLTTVRVEPSFIVAETASPGARLTLGQDITRKLRLGYSMNIVNTEDSILHAEYDIFRRFKTRYTQEYEYDSYRFGFSHDLRLGNAPAEAARTRAAERPRIGKITFPEETLFSGRSLQDKFRLSSGDKYEFPKVEKGMNRLRKAYLEKNRLETRVRLQRRRNEGAVDLTINIDPGPEVQLSFEGAKISGSVQEKVKQIWQDGVFDTARINESVQAIRKSLVEDGYLQSSVSTETGLQSGVKTVRFIISPGQRYSNVALEFSGASGISSVQLKNALKSSGLSLEVYLNPVKVSDYLKKYYRNRGYLNASIAAPEMQLNPETAAGKVVLPVKEGPQFTIGDLKFEGNQAFDYFQLWSLIPISTGSVYSPDSVQESLDVLEEFYRNNGFNEVGILFRIEQSPESTHADIVFQIDENRQSIIGEILIEGNRLTSADLVKRMLTFDTEEALDFSELSNTRRKLYEIGLYSFVDFETEELPGNASKTIKTVRITIKLKELNTYRLNYGGYYDTESGPGGIADFTRRSPLGQASTLGLRLRYDSDLRQGRLYYSQPYIKGFKLKTDMSLFVQREVRANTIFRRVGTSIFQQKKLPGDFMLDYGYSFEHVDSRSYKTDATVSSKDVFESRRRANVPVGRLTGTFWRDTRDSVLNATRGEFMTNAFEFGPKWIGSETGYFKYSGQYFRYVGLDRFLLKAEPGGRKKPAAPRFVYAGAIRLGLSKAFNGQSIIPADRFYSGGGTTMRGFAQDTLGPLSRDAAGTLVLDAEGKPIPEGGEAFFLINNELRFPIFGFLGAAAFLDIGNIYPRISDFRLQDLRKSAGIGLRANVGYFLLRLDYGYKLDRKSHENLESAGEFFFSIGQAF